MTRWTVAALVLALVACGLLVALYLRARDRVDVLEAQASRAGEVEVLKRERDEAAAQVEALTSSVAALRARYEAARDHVPEVVERERVRVVRVRERAEAIKATPPTQAGAVESLRRARAFRGDP